MDHHRSMALLLGCVTLNMITLGTFTLLRRRSLRRWWVRPINRSRNLNGYYSNVFNEMKTRDHEEFFKFTRMWPEQFDELLKLVKPHLTKCSNRRPLDPEFRLALTLSYLAHGDSVQSKAWQFRVGRSTVYKIIPETCQAIRKVLQPLYLPPMTRRRWKKVADGYLNRWQFPNCLGELDGKHIKMKKPRNSGAQYLNYRKFFSIVLMATCDAQYRFTWFELGQFGSVSDGSVWDNSKLARALDVDRIDLPPPEQLPQSNRSTNVVFVADAAFPLKKFIMRPYSQGNAGYPERIFNYRLSRARRTIENAFGILASRWQILQNGFSSSPDKAMSITAALICLHNFIMGRECRLPLAQQAYSNCNRWMRQQNANPIDIYSHCDLDGLEQRDLVRDHFISLPGEAAVPWQYRVVTRGYDINYPDDYPDD